MKKYMNNRNSNYNNRICFKTWYYSRCYKCWISYRISCRYEYSRGLKYPWRNFYKQKVNVSFLTLPIIGICERYGLKEKAILMIKSVKSLLIGKLMTVYIFIRAVSSAASVRLGGHPQFVRPLIN